MKKGIPYSNAAALMQHGCIYDERNGIGIFRARSLLEAGGVIHGFTARKGGVSGPPYDSLNLRLGKDDTEENVRENFRRLCAREGIDGKSLTIVSFEHGNTVLRVDAGHAGSGYCAAPLPPCDGIVTDDPAVTLVTDHADCGCIFVYDPRRRAAGLAHAGWKGTLGRIGGSVVRLMMREFGCKPADMLVSTGPCICQGCYEVDEELAQRFAVEFGTDECAYPGRPGKAQLSLETATAIQLMDAGIPPENITLMEKCTYENPQTLFSHRRDRNGTGDMAGFIKIS
jgi:YfiH family protein